MLTSGQGALCPLERVNTHIEFNNRLHRQAEALQTSTQGLKHAGYGGQRKAEDISMLSKKEPKRLSSFGPQAHPNLEDYCLPYPP